MVQRGVAMLVLRFAFLRIVRGCDGASSVEVFFIDAELVGDKFYRSRWEELSCGRDTEFGDLLSVCEHPVVFYNS